MLASSGSGRNPDSVARGGCGAAEATAACTVPEKEMFRRCFRLSRERSRGKVRAMKYRRYGKTELRMPVITCGGMRYQWKWQDVPPGEIPPENQANLEATIRRAIELGINHIETARGYGTSEMQLGRILPSFPRDKLIVQTKVAPMPDTKEFLRTFRRSMDYLRLEYVDLLSLHGINNRQHLKDSLKPGGCLDAARKLQKEGRCRFVGFSTHATTDIILESVKSGASII